MFVFVSPAAAQLMMEPSKVKLGVAPGATIIDKIYLHNTGEQVENIKVYWEDFTYMEPFTGKKKFFPAGTSEYSMTEWVKYSPQMLVIPPKSKQEINYSIRVPSGFSGGRYGVLFFERGAEKGSEGVAVSVVTRVGVLFFIEVGDTDKSSEVAELKASGSSIEGKVSNNGNVFLFPKGVFYIMDQEGLVVDRGEIEKLYLPSGSTGNFKIDVAQELSAGNYTAVITFDLEGGDSLVREVDFNKTGNGSIEITAIRN